MAQTPEGAIKIAAKKAGLGLDEFRDRIAQGLRRCTRCKEWMLRANFGRDRTRHDGLDASCFSCRRVKVRQVTKGRTSAFHGKKHSDTAKAAISAASKGRPSPMLGKKHTPETRAKISAAVRKVARRGEDCHTYIDGRYKERQASRLSSEAKRWAYDVKVRDGFACQCCGDDRGGNLHSHHIRSWVAEPERRFDIRNGITLCNVCHWGVHHYGLQLWSPNQGTL